MNLKIYLFIYSRFSVDQPVAILSYGFYGPYASEFASYQVSIKLLKDSTEEILAEVDDETIVAKMKEIFHVKFSKPVNVYPGMQYRAWFAIKGPLTCHGSSLTTGHDIVVPVNSTKYDHVKFTYNITGAHQLPEIRFII
jgi:hypothetical protein